MDDHKIRVTVTAEDELRGRINSCVDCPVAHALARAMGVKDRSRRLSVTHQFAMITANGHHKNDMGHTHAATLPREVREWIKAFDQQNLSAFQIPVPFSFTMVFRPSLQGVDDMSRRAESDLERADREAELHYVAEEIGL